MQRRERKSRIYNCRPLAEERRNCQHMQECENPPPPFHSGLPWMDGPKERRRKEPDSFSLFVSSRFMKIAKKRGNGLLANEGRRLVLAKKIMSMQDYLGKHNKLKKQGKFTFLSSEEREKGPLCTGRGEGRRRRRA